MKRTAFIILILLTSVMLWPKVSFAAVTEQFTNQTGKDGTLNEFYRATGNVAMVAVGTGISAAQSGSIVVSTVPEGATVKQAWLYWGGMLSGVTETQLGTITFDGTELNPSSNPAAVLIGEEDPTGNPKKRQSYRADVSSLLTAGGNDTYSVSVSHGKSATFGSTLVIVYEDSNIENGTVVINDGMVMISKSKSGTIANGDEFASTINNLTLGNPPKGQLSIVVSEGPATDVNEFTFTGSSTHNYGDFASNVDGNYWDSRSVDVADYLSSSTTEVTATLKDIDTPGSFSHYFVNMFQTSLKEGDLSTSTMTISKDNPNPFEELTLTAALKNNGSQAASNANFILDFPSNINYVSGSIEIDSVAKTDANDADEARYDSVNNRLIVDIGNIAVDQTKNLSFDVKTANDLDHNTEIALQGNVTADGINVLTDGDGDAADGIDRHTDLTITGGLLTFPSGFSGDLTTNNSFNPAVSRKTGNHAIRLKKNGIAIAEIMMNLNDDYTLANIYADSDDTNNKAFFHGLDQISIASQGSYTLKVPYDAEHDRVRVCVGASSLEQVHEGCKTAYENVSNEFTLTDGQTKYGVTNNQIGSNWELSGLTGSGGQGEGGGGGEVPEFSTYMYLLTIIFSIGFMYKNKSHLLATFQSLQYLFKKRISISLNLLQRMIQ